MCRKYLSQALGAQRGSEKGNDKEDKGEEEAERMSREPAVQRHVGAAIAVFVNLSLFALVIHS